MYMESIETIRKNDNTNNLSHKRLPSCYTHATNLNESYLMHSN